MKINKFLQLFFIIITFSNSIKSNEKETKKNYCFIHAGKEILLDQLNLIINSGLYEKLENIFITLLGEDLDSFDSLPMISKNNKIKIINKFKNIKLFEFPTLKAIQEFSKSNENVNILYIHTKGVRNPFNGNVFQWRKYMEYFLIERYSECLQILETYDTTGCNLWLVPFRHYSGNFWWATSNYINKLIDIKYLNKFDRMECEEWILSSEGKHFCLNDSKKDHSAQYPRSEYYYNEINQNKITPFGQQIKEYYWF